MSILTNLRDKYLITPLSRRLLTDLQADIGKSDQPQRWQMPLNFNGAMFQQRKPESQVTYTTLRNMAKFYEVARACINIRKNQILQLNWEITVKNDNDMDTFATVLPVLKAYFATIGGYNTKMSKLLNLMVEDYLVIDGVSLYKKKTVGGSLLGLVPVDPTTIKLLVDESGATPIPPAPAYEQWIRGEKVAEFTAEEMLYDMLNPRTDNPYGYSVMEALVLTTEAALKAQMFNISWFTDGTIPAGFYELPETWSLDQLKNFQEWFDSTLAGDPRMQNRVRFMPATPSGHGFTPAKNFDFSGVEPYLMWLTKITAALFGVMPQELGFTDDVNRANGLEQSEIAKRNSVRPLARAIEEVMNNLLWHETFALTDPSGQVVNELGPFPELEFKFMDLDTKDELIDSKVTDTMVKLGAVSVDEWRKDKGLDPIGLGHYVLTANGPMLVADIINQTPQERTADEPAGEQVTDAAEEQAMNTSPQAEVQRWEKKALADLKAGRSFRKFYSTILDDYTLVHLAHDLSACTDRQTVKTCFAKWKTAIDEGITHDAERLYKKIDAFLET